MLVGECDIRPGIRPLVSPGLGQGPQGGGVTACIAAATPGVDSDFPSAGEIDVGPPPGREPRDPFTSRGHSVNHRLTGLLVAFAAMTAVAAPGECRADYTYVTTVNSLSAVPGLGITAAPLAGSVIGDVPSTVTVLNFTFTPSGPLTSGSQTLTFTETLAGTPGNQTVTISGTFSYTFGAGFVAAGFTPTTSTTTGSGYTVPLVFVNYLTTSATTGTIQLSIFPVAVPEPASLGMAAMGLGLVGFIGFRRRRAA